MESPPQQNTSFSEARELIRRGLIGEAQDLVSPDMEPSDSAGLAIWGECYETDGAWEAAAWLWQRAVNIFPDNIEFRLHYWQSLLALAREDTVRADSIRRLIDRQGGEFAASDDYTRLLLSYWAAQLLEDSLAEERSDRLIATYPDSQAVIDIVGSRFWDGLYPIWNDNQAQIGFLRDFIARYERFSWKDYAWRWLLSAHAALGDTAAVISEAGKWVATEPDDPYVLITAAGYLTDIGNRDNARVWIEKSYKLRDNLRRPSHVPEAEWLLYGPQIKASFPLKMAEIRLDEGEITAAMGYAQESLDLAVYGVDEYATAAPQKYMMSRLLLADGDTASASNAFVETLMEGDVRNGYPSLADSILRQIYGFKTDRELLEFCRKHKSYDGITFTDVTTELGLGEASGGRFAWGDFDNDGDDDLLVNGSRLYRNDMGRFTYLMAEDQYRNFYVIGKDAKFNDITEAAGINAPGCHGGVWGDYNRDGRLDLFCFSSSSDSGKTERLFRNKGNGTFEDVTEISGDIRDNQSTEAAVWCDFNSDGRLDLYVPGYERPYDSANDMGSGWPDRLLIQDENSVFHEQAEASGIIPPFGRHLCGRSPVACDFDRDGDLDLYVGNYRLQPNQLWINDGNGWFDNRAAWYKVDGEQVDGWWGHTIGCQWGDFDTDGDFDLIVGNLAHPRYITFSNRTMLYRNDGYAEGFTDVRREWGIKYDECHSEPVWGDLDNDGDLDLFITSVYPNRRSYLYRNDGDHFTDITFLAGARVFDSWGCALADYDRDGDLDLVTKDESRAVLLRNDTKGGNWLEIAPVSIMLTNHSCIGLIVEVTDSTGRCQVRNIEGGKGAGSQSSLTAHFGLGEAEAVKVTYYVAGKTIVKERRVKNMFIQDNIEMRPLGMDEMIQVRPLK